MAFALLVVAVPATAQVYKCVDKGGRTSYQQLPCPEAQKATRMDLPLNNGSGGGDGDDATWSAMAKRRELVVGMPRAYVVQARGSPQEMRPGRPGENAVEVWRYQRPDQDLGVGFNKGVVAWINERFSEVAVVDPEPSVRKFFHIARKCTELAGEAGAPTSVVEEVDENLGRRVTRHIWEAAPGDREITTVTCVDGLVARVDRLPVL